MYGATICGYLAPLWTIPLLLAPLAFFFGGVTPVHAYDVAFFAHVVPFLVATRLAFMVRAWRVPTWRSEQFHLAATWLHLRALAHVLRGKPLRFHVTPKLALHRRSLRLVAPHLALLALTAVGIAYRGALVASGAEPAMLAAYACNVFWSLHNAICFAPFIAAARGGPPREREAADEAREPVRLRTAAEAAP
jgi:cellulose synthase (UDP-forming)